MVAAGGASWKLQSECQPAPKLVAFSSGSRRSSSTLGRPAIGLMKGSWPNAPICSVKASSASRLSGWSGKATTPWRAQAAFTSASTEAGKGCERSRPAMLAPKPEGWGVTVIVRWAPSASSNIVVLPTQRQPARPMKHLFASVPASL
jgi:hypothetical protein